MKIKYFGPFKAVGVSVRTSHQTESNDATELISKLRFRFHELYLGGLIQRRMDRCEFLEIFTDYETDHLGAFTFIKGHRVFEIVDVPDDMMAIDVPRRKYAVFTADTAINEDAVPETEEAILRFFEQTQECQRAYTTDLYISDGVLFDYYVSIK